MARKCRFCGNFIDDTNYSFNQSIVCPYCGRDQMLSDAEFDDVEKDTKFF